VKDTVGLQKFYETNKNNYLWDTRLDVSIFTIKDPSIVKSLSKMLNKGTSEGEILAKFNNDSIMKIKIEHKKFVKGENMALEGIEWKPGISELKTLADNEQQLIQVHKVVPPEPKLLNEARGLITSDYQNFLEKEWLAELRAKYPVKVNHEVFQTLLKN
jgi:peptidyl-prolyl cis-trans isomerase SurA